MKSQNFDSMMGLPHDLSGRFSNSLLADASNGLALALALVERTELLEEPPREEERPLVVELLLEEEPLPLDPVPAEERRPELEELVLDRPRPRATTLVVPEPRPFVVPVLVALELVVVERLRVSAVEVRG